MQIDVVSLVAISVVTIVVVGGGWLVTVVDKVVDVTVEGSVIAVKV